MPRRHREMNVRIEQRKWHARGQRMDESYKNHDAHRFGVLYVQADPVSRRR